MSTIQANVTTQRSAGSDRAAVLMVCVLALLGVAALVAMAG